jgi:hypothetical protein
MKTNTLTLPPAQERIFRCSETIDSAILVKLLLATLAGFLSYVAAVFTTVLESGGFWRYLWLGVCLVTFASASLLIVLACRDFGNRSCLREISR